MSVRHDPRRKYFTEVVSKLQLAVWIQTTRQRIRGAVHLLPDQRWSDHLSQAHEFLAVTDVTAYEDDREFGHPLEAAGFKLPPEMFGADALTLPTPQGCR